MGPFCPLFLNFLLFVLGNFSKNPNDAEFNICIGSALVLFLVFMDNKQKDVTWTMHLPPPPRTPEIDINRYLLVLKHYFHQIS